MTAVPARVPAEELKEILAEVRRIEIAMKGPVATMFAGGFKSVFKGHGLEFAGIREYVRGDDFRSIHWKCSARMNRLYVREHREERESRIWLVLDVSGSQDFGSRTKNKRRVTAEFAAAIGLSAVATNDRLGAIFFSDRIEKRIRPAKGRSHTLSVVSETLAHRPSAPGTDLARVLTELMHTIRTRSIVFLVSDFEGTGYERILAVLARRHDVIAVPVADPLEEGLPDEGLLALRDPETGDETLIDTSDPRVRARYAETAARERETRKALFLRAGVDEIEIRTDRPFHAELAAFFARRQSRWARSRLVHGGMRA